MAAIVLPESEQVLEKALVRNVNLVAERKSRRDERLIPRTKPTANGRVCIVAMLPILRLRDSRRPKRLSNAFEIGEQLGLADRLT